MSELELPEGGRVEMETYLRNLCIRLANECPTQLRHFLRPSSNAGKKADIVAPRFDRFLAKTVSGVFNTLKTVVPGFEIDSEEEVMPLPTLIPLSDIPWRFVEDIKSVSRYYIAVQRSGINYKKDCKIIIQDILDYILHYYYHCRKI